MRFLIPQAEQNPEAAEQATAQLKQLIGSDSTMEGSELEQMLRLVPDLRGIWAGRFQSQPAIFRLALSAKEIEGFASEWAELQRAHSYMADGPERVAAPLALGCGGQVMVLQQAAGTPLLDHLWSLEAEARVPWFAKAAGWNCHFCTPTQAHTPVNRGPWRNWAEAALARQTHAPLIEVETRVLQKMKKLSRLLRDHEMWRTAIGHGDFHPNNLIAAPDHLTGIDLGGSNRTPVYKDMARFLTHMARRGMFASDRHRFGVDALAYQAFVQAFDLDEAEATLFLPYLICFETLIRVEHPAMPSARVEHGVLLAERLLEDLRQIV